MIWFSKVFGKNFNSVTNRCMDQWTNCDLKSCVYATKDCFDLDGEESDRPTDRQSQKAKMDVDKVLYYSYIVAT